MAAETSSTMALGTPLPPLRLLDVVTGRLTDARELARGKAGLLVAFVANGCPFVRHIRRELVAVAHEALDDGFAVIAICASPHADDRPDRMRQVAAQEGWRFPYLYDEAQQAARALGAACTPDLFVFDRALRLAYRGAFDDSHPSSDVPVSGAALQAALGAIVRGGVPEFAHVPSVGSPISGG